MAGGRFFVEVARRAASVTVDGGRGGGVLSSMSGYPQTMFSRSSAFQARATCRGWRRLREARWVSGTSCVQRGRVTWAVRRDLVVEVVGEGLRAEAVQRLKTCGRGGSGR